MNIIKAITIISFFTYFVILMEEITIEKIKLEQSIITEYKKINPEELKDAETLYLNNHSENDIYLLFAHYGENDPYDKSIHFFAFGPGNYNQMKHDLDELKIKTVEYIKKPKNNVYTQGNDVFKYLCMNDGFRKYLIKFEITEEELYSKFLKIVEKIENKFEMSEISLQYDFNYCKIIDDRGKEKWELLFVPKKKLIKKTTKNNHKYSIMDILNVHNEYFINFVNIKNNERIYFVETNNKILKNLIEFFKNKTHYNYLKYMLEIINVENITDKRLIIYASKTSNEEFNKLVFYLTDKIFFRSFETEIRNYFYENAKFDKIEFEKFLTTKNINLQHGSDIIPQFELKLI